MTLRPHHSHTRFIAVHGPGYPRDAMCANPACNLPADEAHHVFSRRQVGKTDWVQDMENGTMIPNKLGLCRSCHLAVTGGLGGHRARIQYLDEERAFYWIDLLTQEGEPIECFAPRSVVELSDWLQAMGRDEDADALLGDAA